MYSERWALVALIAFSVLVTAGLSLAAWRRRYTPLGRAFFYFTLTVTIYAFGYMCELASDTLAAIRFWLRVESIGIAFLPTAWIALAVHHTRAKSRHWPQLYAILLMLSTITFIISNTSELHHLHYGPLRLNPDAPFPVVAFDPGPWYWAHSVFTNLAVLFGNVLYARAWHNAPRNTSRQAFVLFLGSLFPWCVYIAYLLKAIPWGIDPHPIVFLVPGILYAWATFGMGLLEIAPIARQAIFDKLSDSVLVFDRNGRLADFNLAAAKIFPALGDAAKGREGIALFRDFAAMAPILAGTADEQPMWLDTGRERINFQLRRSELYSPDGETVGYMVILRDISHFSAIVEGLRLQAAIDPLTKAWNRTRWHKVGNELAAEARTANSLLALVLADLDDFKYVNDTHGHPSGDTVLAEFARTCRDSLRPEDIFGRYGGDEFVIILPGLDRDAAVALAERLRRAVEAMDAADGDKKIAVTASFGVVAERGTAGLTLEDLVRKADKMLYAAKNAGGNRVCVCENGGDQGLS